MVEGKSVDEVNKEINDELRNLIVLMSGLNIEHKKSINLCYAEYFEQRVHEFHQIEKQIQLLAKTFASKAKDFKEMKISGDVYKFHEESLFIVKEGLDFVKTEGFGWDRSRKSQKECNKQQAAITKKVVNKPSSRSNDNFCEFILKDDRSDKTFEVLGYGMETVKPSSTQNVSDTKKLTKAPKRVRDAVGLSESPKIEITAMDLSLMENTGSPIEMAVTPKGTGLTPRETEVTPRGTGVTPKGSGVAPRGTGVTPRGTGVTPRGTGVTPKGTGVTPKGTGVTPKGTGVTSTEMVVLPIEVDEVDSYQAFHNYRNSNFPIRLRFKRNLSSLMPKNEKTTTDSDEVELKRKR